MNFIVCDIEYLCRSPIEKLKKCMYFAFLLDNNYTVIWVLIAISAQNTYKV